MAIASSGATICNTRLKRHWGTLSCTVRSRQQPGARYLLCVNHVIGLNGYANPGDPIAVWDGRQWVTVARFERAAVFRGGGPARSCDAALALVTQPDLVDDLVLGGMPLSGLCAAPMAGMALRFLGAGSQGLVNAEVCQPDQSVPVAYEDYFGGRTFSLELGGQILYGRQVDGRWRPVSLPGDSGALVLNEAGEAVGLHVGRPAESFPLQFSVMTPMQTVLDALGVELITAGGGVAGADLAPASASAALPVQPAAMAAVDPDQWGERGLDMFGTTVRSLLELHNAFGGVNWCLTAQGLQVDGRLDRTPGRLVTVPRVWGQYGEQICAAARDYGVPLELIIATLCTESSGQERAVRTEPGWTTDEARPDRISAGLMQTLLSSARDALQRPGLDREALFKPEVSIAAGTACIAMARHRSHFDPPVVACIYNSGGLSLNEGSANRWRMTQFPLGTGAHADRFTQWFNDVFAFFASADVVLPEVPSFVRLFRGG